MNLHQIKTSLWGIPFLCVLMSLSSQAECLRLREGTLSLGGYIVAPLRIDNNGAFSSDAIINPQIGFFSFNQLEYIVDIAFQTNIPQAQIALLAEYFFLNTSRIIPYIGAGFGVLMTDSEAKLIPKIPGGILIAINPCLAIDIQILLEVQFSPSTGFEQFSITPGFFGIRALF